MPTVKELKEILNTFPENYEVVIYPKYSSDEVDGFRKHTFRVDQVCEHEPFAVAYKNDPVKLKEYFNGREFEDYEVNNHVAIIF